MSESDGANKAGAQAQAEVGGRAGAAEIVVTVAGWLCLVSSVALLVLTLLWPSAPTPSEIDVQWTLSVDGGLATSPLTLIPDRPSSSEVRTTADDQLARLVDDARAAVESEAEIWDDETWDRLSLSGADRTSLTKAQRWRFVFDEGLTEAEYARQLAALGIDIGVVGGSKTSEPQIQYISKLTAQKPESRTGLVAAETRLYLSWHQGNLDEADRELLARADIDTTGKVVVHFCSEELEQKLSDMERKFMNRESAEIEYTLFGVRPIGNSFEFYVRKQD